MRNHGTMHHLNQRSSRIHHLNQSSSRIHHLNQSSSRIHHLSQSIMRNPDTIHHLNTSKWNTQFRYNTTTKHSSRIRKLDKIHKATILIQACQWWFVAWCNFTTLSIPTPLAYGNHNICQMSHQMTFSSTCFIVIRRT